MLNVYERRSPSAQQNLEPSYRAADFLPILSAFDEEVNQNLRLADKRYSSYEGKLNLVEYMRKNSSKKSRIDSGKAKKINRHSGYVQHAEKPYEKDTQKDDLSRLHSKSLPYALDKRCSDCLDKLDTKAANVCSRIPSNEGSPTEISSKVANGWEVRENLLTVRLTEKEIDLERIAVGLPNSRALPVTTNQPKGSRTLEYLWRLKTGLADWVENQSTKLEQAELDGNKDANLMATHLHRLKQRLETIKNLERDYLKYWEQYKHLHPGSFGNSRMIYRCQENGPYLKEISRSAMTLPTPDQSDEIQHSSMCGELGPQNDLSKPAWYSSMVNVFRPKMKKDHSSLMLSVDSATGADPEVNDIVVVEGVEVRRRRRGQKDQRRRSRTRLSRNLHSSKPEALGTPINRQEEYLEQVLCEIESQIEYLSGTFKCEIIGITSSKDYVNKEEYKITIRQGPPRLPSVYLLQNGRVRQIPLTQCTIPMDSRCAVKQKWTSYGRLQSSYNSGRRHRDRSFLQTEEPISYSYPQQAWENPAFIFSPCIDGVLTMKVAESKRVGRDRVLLYQAFDVIGILDSKGYQLSTPLRDTGTTRINLLLKWCPLADTDDESLVFYTPSADSALMTTSNSTVGCRPENVRLIVTDTEVTPKVNSHFDNTYASRSGSSIHGSSRVGESQSYSLVSPYYERLSKSSISNSSEQLSDLPSNRLGRRPNITIISIRPSGSIPTKCTTRRSKMSHWISMPNLEESATQKCGQEEEEEERPKDRKKVSVPILREPDVHEEAVTKQFGTQYDTGSVTLDENPLENYGSNCLSDEINEMSLMDKLDKIEQSEALQDDQSSLCPELLQRLKFQLNRVRGHLTRNRDNFPVSANQSPRHRKDSYEKKETSLSEKASEISKGDTLTSLFQSFSFLNEFNDQIGPPAGKTSVSSIHTSSCGSSKAASDIVESTSPNWLQLNLALSWHLDYVDRLLNEIKPRKQPPSERSVVLEPRQCSSSSPSLCMKPNLSNGLCTYPVKVYKALVALCGQTDILTEISDTWDQMSSDQLQAKSNFLSNLLPEDMRRRGQLQLIEVLIWPNISKKMQRDSHLDRDTIESANLMIVVTEFKQKLSEFYQKRIYPNWPEVNSTEVIDVLTEDILDYPVNGNNMTHVPITQIGQRLNPSTPLGPNVSPSSLPLSNVTDEKIAQILSYLAGQCNIQNKLNSSTPEQMIDAFPYYKRCYDSAFDILTLTRKRRSASGIPRDQAYGFTDLRSLCLAACYSTNTWIHVAHLISSGEKAVARKAIGLLKEFDPKLAEVSKLTRSYKTNLLNSRDSCTFDIVRCDDPPILFFNGPPAQFLSAVYDLVSHRGHAIEFLPPLWISMIIATENTQDQKMRLDGLRGLAVLLEQRHKRIQYGSRLLPDMHVKSRSDFKEETCIKAVSALYSHLSMSDPNPKVQRFAKRVIDRMESEAKDNGSASKSIQVTRAIKQSWGRYSPAYRR
ncbi:unnamed protein product [Calicophoron daubneyi]|uniref:Uncharacterized protein n=1 Tax=Calicophoron daubneyi TaxID=300641 RepID=A0AAV2TTB4_CALDB